MFPTWSDWNIDYTSKGIMKRRIWQALRVLMVVVSIVLGYQARRSGHSLGYFKELYRHTLVTTVASARRALNSLAK